jgi:hypothetical protein
MWGCCAATQIACVSIALVLSRSENALTCWADNSLTSCPSARIVLAQQCDDPQASIAIRLWVHLEKNYVSLVRLI